MSTLIIAAVLVSSIVIPFMLMRRGVKSHEKELVGELNQLAQNSQAKIGDFEVLKDIVIGLDNDKTKLFFIHKNEHLATKEVVDLLEYKSCNLEKAENIIRNPGGDRTIVQSVSLRFKPTQKKNPQIILELFNADFDCPTLSGELQLAQKWEAILNN